jgi:NodT family efflux transporter outer membrane factor (OMF) lipoprotein
LGEKGAMETTAYRRLRAGLTIAAIVTTGAISALFAGCVTVGPDFKQPDAKLENQWLESLPQTAQASPSNAAEWWSAFDDPVLTEFERLAYERNLSLQIAGLHIFEARAQLAISTRDLFVQQGSLSAGAARLDNSGIGPFPPEHLWTEHFRASASWELDFWGKYRRQIESDRAKLSVSEAAYDNALVSLFGDVANAYIDLRAQERRLDVAKQNLQSVQQTHAITRTQYRTGAASMLDVEQSATLVAETEAQIPPLEKARAQDRDTLAVLLADTPDSIEALLAGASAIPAAPAHINVGIPRDLLRRRPDVRQAALNAAAQSALIGVQKAKLYPSLSLTGIFGMSSGEQHSLGPLDWGSKTFTLFSAGVTLPIFDRAQLQNAVRMQDAAFQEAIFDYQNTVFEAQREVEDAIASLRTSRTALEATERAADSSQRALKLATVQYKAGSTGFDSVLSASRSMLHDRDALAQNQGLVSLAAVSLYRSLGGGWQVAAGRPVVSEPVVSQMKERTNWGTLIDLPVPTVISSPDPSPVARQAGEPLEPKK